MRAGIQLDMFSAPASSAVDDGMTMQLMRPHKWAHGPVDELPLISIEIVSFEARWMWAACLNSHNGAGQGCRALPKWGRFAESKLEAVQMAVDEVRGFMHRATNDERPRITKWLGDVLSTGAWPGAENRLRNLRDE